MQKPHVHATHDSMHLRLNAIQTILGLCPAGFAWAAQALSQACAVLLARQPGCARVHQVWMCMAPPMALLIASLTSGIICLARMSPILQRMQEMEIKKDDNKSKPSSNSGKGHAAKSLFPQQAMSAPKPPVAEAVVTKSKGDPLGVITSGEVDAASASWLYAAPVSGMVAWTALSIGAYFVACVTPSVKNDNSIEGLCAAFAIIATVVVLLVMHAYKEAMGSGTLMLMMLFIAADGHPILWMPRMLCGALGFMLTMRLAAYCMPDD